uniref:IS66 family transposase n=1 Tax=Vibrio tasmaniensis TaxID=212663 RepID=UPI001118E004|nr:transposase [Vibrio tasmaniensis]
MQWAVSWFQKLYRVEQALKDKTREERYVTRQSNIQSLLNEFKAWLDKSVTQVPPKSKLGEAISYIQSQSMVEASTSYR